MLILIQLDTGVSILVLVDVPLESNAIYSLKKKKEVSILVLVDVPLECTACVFPACFYSVSILVLVDVPLELVKKSILKTWVKFQSLF